ncbi:MULTISPECIES: hypothetical protein [Salinicoccus]|uniref:hypothetical protein n=1 Tax=Salinicoccus TaxID=45669 RepID=UPI000A944A15|nr:MULTISPECIES: hypothetical protein [Salinicoccus]
MAKEALVCYNFSEEADTIEIAEEWKSDHIVLENDGNSLEGGRLHLSPYGAAVFIKDE